MSCSLVDVCCFVGYCLLWFVVRGVMFVACCLLLCVASFVVLCLLLCVVLVCVVCSCYRCLLCVACVEVCC